MEAVLLRKKNGRELLTELKRMRGDEQKLVARMVCFLIEVERRGLHLDRGYDSMFAFCTEYLEYTGAEAHIRIQAARLGAALPELPQKIAEGKISLSVAAKAQASFRNENNKRKARGQKNLDQSEKRRAVEQLERCTKEQAEFRLAGLFGSEAPVKKVWIELDPELDRKLTELKGLLAHKNFDGDLTKLISIMADISLQDLRKDKPSGRAAAASAPQAAAEKSQPSVRQTKRDSKRSRYISIKIRREVWEKSEGRCTYLDPVTGRQCGGTHGLEIDHIQGFALGGSNDLDNLTLLCSAHNKHKNGVCAPRASPTANL